MSKNLRNRVTSYLKKGSRIDRYEWDSICIIFSEEQRTLENELISHLEPKLNGQLHSKKHESPTFEVEYEIISWVSFADHYVFNQHRECYNLRTGKRIKKTRQGGSIGYNIKGKFYSLTRLRPYLQKPKKESCPF